MWRDPERCVEVYWSKFPGAWHHGDYVPVEGEGYWHILGRADGVIKVAGERIGSAEIESIATGHPAMAEAACTGFPREAKGGVIICFITPRREIEEPGKIGEDVKKLITGKLGKPFGPEKIVIVDELSKKVMRRVIRDMALGVEPGELSVVENPETIEKLRSIIEKVKKEQKELK